MSKVETASLARREQPVNSDNRNRGSFPYVMEVFTKPDYVRHFYENNAFEKESSIGKKIKNYIKVYNNSEVSNNFEASNNFIKVPKEFEELKKTVLLPENDLLISLKIEELRNKVEQPDKWDEIRRLAGEEIEKIDLNTSFNNLLKKLNPFIIQAPAGHSRGHMMMDLINVAILLNNKVLVSEEMKVNTAELIAGVIAGIFHDVGTPFGRYIDRSTFSGHAGIGAYLFGVIAEETGLPENLRMMIQYAIAAHTHFTHNISVTRQVDKKNITYTRKPYIDVDTNNQPRWAVWITRWVDRMGTRGLLHIIRHILTKAEEEPTEDYLRGKFYSKFLREQFSLDMEKGGILDHLLTYAGSDGKEINKSDDGSFAINDEENKKKENPYNKFDFPFLSDWLFGLNNQTVNFVNTVINRQTEGDNGDNSGFAIFANLARVFEPAPNLEEALGLLKQKFTQWGKENLEDKQVIAAWERGFRLLFNIAEDFFVLYNENLENNNFNLGQSNVDQFINTIIDNARRSLKKINNDFHKKFDEKFVKNS